MQTVWYNRRKGEENTEGRGKITTGTTSREAKEGGSK
jgi:hypothetical protein